MSQPSVLRGDEAQLYEALAARLRRAIASEVNAPPAVVDDACSIAWLNFLRRQPDRISAWGWLFVTARREAWRLAARERRTVAVDDLDTFIGVETMDERTGLLEDLRCAARGLRDRERQMLALQAAGFTYAEIHRITGDSIRTIDRQLRRVRAKLREIRAD